MEILALTPPQSHRPDIAIAASRAGAIGLLDIGGGCLARTRSAGVKALRAQLGESDRWGIAIESGGCPEALAGTLTAAVDAAVPWLLLSGLDFAAHDFAAARRDARHIARHVIVEAYSVPDALAAQQAGFDGVVLKGEEGGGVVGEQSSFVLLQRIRARLAIPYWARGGIGLHSAAASALAGAAGVVLCEQLWLAAESPLSSEERRALRALDGTETVLLGSARRRFRFFSHSGRSVLEELSKRSRRAAAADQWVAAEILEARCSAPADGPLVPMGQEIAFAAPLAARFRTVSGIVAAFRNADSQRAREAAEQRALGAGAALAREHGTRFPIVQGPMTRVSDGIAFCDAVSRNGALPSLALALMTRPVAERVLADARTTFEARPWAVGLLGFLPGDIVAGQMKAIEAARPPYAVVAGGYPDQVRQLATSGTAAYLHAPSPNLAGLFAEDGMRRLVLEGRECGGHVGPLSSFALWDQAVDRLLGTDRPPSEFRILFAGGVHDAVSAAMVAVLASPLVARGAKIGVLAGTAYLFTPEAVATGAITAAFQGEALACVRTVLLNSGPGQSTRCASTPFADEFEARRRQLVASGASTEAMRWELEMLQLGRLALAARGAQRIADDKSGNRSAIWVPVSRDVQRANGLFMMGEAATLRQACTPMADLHADVAEGGVAILRNAAGEDSRSVQRPSNAAVAIVGMASVFPESADVKAFWQNILRGFDPVRDVPEDRWKAEAFFRADRFDREGVYCTRGAFLGDIRFDPLKYRIPPASLASIEPIQLISLEAASRALEDAFGPDAQHASKLTAVIFGVTGPHELGLGYAFRTLLRQHLAETPRLAAETKREVWNALSEDLPRWTEDSFPGVLNNLVAGRISNHLDLHGPNLVVDAACASSLAALQVAIDQLRSGACDTAIVGAADATNGPGGFMSFSRTQALSPQGKSRPFDAGADGVVLGEGVAAVVLRRLEDAERDGNNIYAVIRGIGASSDGRHCSVTAPDPAGQLRALRRAYADAGLRPSVVGLIEAHGTGTVVGDRAEIAALQELLGDDGVPPNACALGSVKSMIGHAKAAAGLAGLIKAVLALNQKTLPPTAHVGTPNPQLTLPQSPVFLSSEVQPWIRRSRERPRCAGVSAFGFGGTNFHVVLEEYVAAAGGRTANLYPRPAEILSWSAPDRASLERELQRLDARLAPRTDVDLAALGATLAAEAQRGSRQGHAAACRLAIVAADGVDLRRKLKQFSAGDAGHDNALVRQGIYYGEGPACRNEALCVLFPGQGAQRVNMLRDVLHMHPWGVRIFEEADALASNDPAAPLSRFLLPVPAFDDAARLAQQAALNRTEIAQPALAATGIFALEVLRFYGLDPGLAAGHSFGEYLALHAAGCLAREDLLRLAAARGRAVREVARSTGRGGMAAVAASAGAIEAVLAPLRLPVAAANRNAPDQTVIAGPIEALERAIVALEAQGMRAHRLPVEAAYHTPALAAAADAIAPLLAEIDIRAAQRPVFSNVTASAFPAEPSAIRELMLRHFSEPVGFVEQVQSLYRAGARVFVEAGPGRTLTSHVGRILGAQPHAALPIDAADRHGGLQLAHLLAQACALGLAVRLDRWFDGRASASAGIESLFSALEERDAAAARAWVVGPARCRAPAASAPVAPGATAGTGISLLTGRPVAPVPASGGAAQMMLEKWRPLEAEIQRSAAQLVRLQEQVRGFLAELAGPSPANAEPPGIKPFLAFRDEGAREPAPSAGHSRPEAPRPEPAPEAAVSGESPAALPSLEEFRADLISAVCQRTGYPPEALREDLLLEADLGIDSIKRMEIFAALRGKYQRFFGNATLAALQQDPSLLATFARLKSLGDVVASYAEQREKLARTANEGSGPARAESRRTPTLVPATSGRDDGDASHSPVVASAGVRRFELRSVEAPRCLGQAAPWLVPGGQSMLVLGRPSDWGPAWDQLVVVTGIKVCELVPGESARRLSESEFEADFRSVASLGEARRLIAAAGHRVGGILSFLGLSPRFAAPGIDRDDAGLELTSALVSVLRAFQGELLDSAKTGGGYLVNLTGMGGRFGIGKPGGIPLAQAGSLGVFKSVQCELPALRVRNIDLDPATGAGEIAGMLAVELLSGNGDLESGLVDLRRWRPELIESPLDSAQRHRLALGPESVILALGGGRGITGVCTERLAREYGCRVVIVGRTDPRRIERAGGASSGEDADALRRRLIARATGNGTTPDPAKINRELREIVAARETAGTVAALSRVSAAVDYRSCDVRDRDRLASLIEDVYDSYGRIDGVIHGAGVIEDQALADKTSESLERVFRTKVDAAKVLVERLRPETLEFLVFFSSIAARFGNARQADYSAANEYLNKLCQHLLGTWSSRSIAINWGPWTLGVVNPLMQRLFAEQGLEMIAPRVGAELFLAELEAGPRCGGEIVIGSGIERLQALRPGAAVA